MKKIRQAQGPFRMCPVVVTSFEIAMRDRKLLQVNRSGVALSYLHIKIWLKKINFLNSLFSEFLYIQSFIKEMHGAHSAT